MMLSTYLMPLFYSKFLILIFCSTSLATVDLTIVGGKSVLCAGVQVTMECLLTGNILIWNTPDGDINFIRGVESEAVAGSYFAQLTQLNDTHLSSTLTFTLMTQININCSDTSESNSITAFVEGRPSAPDRPLTALDRIKRLNNTFSHVTVLWNIPEINNAHISSYVITVDPSIPLHDSGGIPTDTLLFQSRQLTLTVQHGRQYYISVKARSCDDSVEGAVSTRLNIKVQVPPTVARCTTLPVYNYYSNNLLRIEAEWDPIPDIVEDITAGITADVQKYIISLVPVGIAAPAINATLGATDRNVCSSKRCKFDFERIEEMLALYYDLYITAKNLLTDGYGEAQICSNLTISATNDLLSVDIRKSDFLEVICRPLTRFEGTASCVVTYMILPDAVNYIEASDTVGGAEDIISVLLIGAPEMTISIAAATQGGTQDIVVNGSFETANDSTTEGPSKDNYCPTAPWVLGGGIFITTLLTGVIAGIIAMMLCRRTKNIKKRSHSHPYDYISPKDISLESNKSYATSVAPQNPQM